MRKSILVLLSSILLTGCAVLPSPAQKSWSQEEFILGTFWDPPVRFKAKNFSADSIRFQFAKNAYFNLLTGTQNEWGIDRSPEGQVWNLRLANAVGLRYLVTDSRFYPSFEVPFDEGKAKEVTAFYRSLPSSLRRTMAGYNLGDEPHFTREHLENAKQWNRFFAKNDPEKLSYLNLVASFAPEYNWGGFKGGKSDKFLDRSEKAAYEQYLADYVDTLEAGVVSYDHYPFMMDGSVRRDFFYNIEIAREKAGGRPWWAYPMTTGHMDYVDPREEHLRVMYFCPVAYGAKGLIVFSYASFNVKTYRPGMIDLAGNPTETYWVARRLNLFTRDILAPIVMNSRHLGVWHSADFPDAQLYIDHSVRPSGMIVDEASDERVMAGLFGDSEYVYILLVNKSIEAIHDISITLVGEFRSIHIGPSPIDFTEHTPRTYRPLQSRVNNQKTTFTLQQLFGGEVRVIRVPASGISE